MNQSQDKLGNTKGHFEVKDNFEGSDENTTKRTTQQTMRTSMGHPLSGTGIESKTYNNFMNQSTFDSEKPKPLKKKR